MGSSPFCPKCLALGELRHTYKVAGRAEFKCGTCKKTHLNNAFKSSDFVWQTDLNGWKAGLEKELSNPGGNIKEELTRLESLWG